MEFTVCSYNMGYHTGRNYTDLLRFTKGSTKEKLTDKVRTKYQTIEIKTKELLEKSAQVFCLQKAKSENRPLIESLKQKNFELVYCDHAKPGSQPEFGCAIALNKDHFSNIKNHSTDITCREFPNKKPLKKDIAIATATHTSTNQQFCFVSAYALEFNFTNPNSDQEKVDAGDYYCQEIVKTLSKIHGSAMQIIGADTNAHPDKWKNRFTIFENQGFTIYAPPYHTNVNPSDNSDQERTVDFFFTKQPTTLSEKTKEYTTEILSAENDPLGWDTEKNASDHRPIFVKIQF